jgi:hypothetical protein
VNGQEQKPQVAGGAVRQFNAVCHIPRADC